MCQTAPRRRLIPRGFWPAGSKSDRRIDQAAQPPTVADLRALKGKQQLITLHVFTLDEAAAAEEDGSDIVSVPPKLVTNPEYRNVAPSLFSMSGFDRREAGTRENCFRLSGKLCLTGADTMYSSAGIETAGVVQGTWLAAGQHDPPAIAG